MHTNHVLDLLIKSHANFHYNRVTFYFVLRFMRRDTWKGAVVAQCSPPIRFQFAFVNFENNFLPWLFLTVLAVKYQNEGRGTEPMFELDHDPWEFLGTNLKIQFWLNAKSSHKQLLRKSLFKIPFTLKKLHCLLQHKIFERFENCNSEFCWHE